MKIALILIIFITIIFVTILIVTIIKKNNYAKKTHNREIAFVRMIANWIQENPHPNNLLKNLICQKQMKNARPKNVIINEEDMHNYVEKSLWIIEGIICKKA